MRVYNRYRINWLYVFGAPARIGSTGMSGLHSMTSYFIVVGLCCTTCTRTLHPIYAKSTRIIFRNFGWVILWKILVRTMTLDLGFEFVGGRAWTRCSFSWTNTFCEFVLPSVCPRGWGFLLAAAMGLKLGTVT